MTRIASLWLGVWLSASASNALAGRIFGDIKLDGKPVPAGLPVMISAPSPAGAEAAKADDTGKEAKPKTAPAMADSAATDKFGSYKLNVKAEGKCILTVVYDKQALTLEVFSYKDATRYDLVLERKDGKYFLRRK